MDKKTLDSILYIFLVLAIMLSVINFSLIASRGASMKEAVLLAERESLPPNLEIVKITASSCHDCTSADAAVESLKRSANITLERTMDFASNEAKQLIEQYGIQKLPSIIVTGEINKSSVLRSSEWKPAGDAVYSVPLPPYIDAGGNVKGIASLTHIVDESCANCTDMGQVILFFTQSGVKFSSNRAIDYNTADAKSLITEFSMQKVPALVVSEDVLEYAAVAQVWNQLNSTKKGGSYALHPVQPPYRNLQTGGVEGLTSVIYLTDDCPSCYNVKINKQILDGTLGIVIVNETDANATSAAGKALIAKYNITKVPVILVSPDAAAYMAFVQAWQQVGDAASDGWYVMRKPEVLGTYKDIATGEVVAPQRG